ncbi:MAG: hypothetical protein GWO87_03640, partial [Xanthomonadaceae bacterium]|nr:hypothetical protein [Rhodospirillaceae bacterium]NIA18252.1 hypothetical protein [Xanthomonadaceae bacterium]
MNNIKPKLIVILGPTASGKTKLGVKLCSKFNGEIVSADSRQVYKGMDVGTGKDIRDYCLKLPITNYQLPITKISNSKSQILNKSKIKNSKFKKYRIVKIPYHLIDIVNPKKRFNLDQYQKMAFQAIDD